MEVYILSHVSFYISFFDNLANDSTVKTKLCSVLKNNHLHTFFFDHSLQKIKMHIVFCNIFNKPRLILQRNSIMRKLVKSIALSVLTLSSFITTAQTDKSLLWEISGKGLEKPSYVFGTIHMICQDDYLMTKTIQNTLKNVDSYYAEINFGDQQNIAIMQKSMMSEIPLSERLEPAKYNELKSLLKEVVDLDITQFEYFTDAAIVSMITFKSFPCTDFKMYEMELLQAAILQQKKLGGLETVEQQMEILSKSLGQDAVIEMLHDLKKEGFENTKKMVELYKSENVQGLYDYMKTSSYMTDEVYNEMLTKRNHNWVNEMPEIMQNQSVFFAVGAAHLGGNNGILKLLKDNGYTVKPVKIQ